MPLPKSGSEIDSSASNDPENADVSVRSRSFLRIGERQFILLLADLLALLIIFGVFRGLPLLADRTAIFHNGFRVMGLVAGAWFLSALIFGLYNLRHVPNFFRLGAAVILTGLLSNAVAPYLGFAFPKPQAFPWRDYAGLAVGFGIVRPLAALLVLNSSLAQRFLILGAGKAGRQIAEEIQSYNRRVGFNALEIVGYVDDLHDSGERIVEGIPIIGSSSDLASLAAQTQTSEVIVSIQESNRMRPEAFSQIVVCRELGIPVTKMATIYEALTHRVPVEHAGRDLDAVLPLKRALHYRIFLLCKRTFDLLCAIPGAMFMLALCPMIWFLQVITRDRGPLFYSQIRVGLGGKLFQIVKFRSMRVNAEEKGAQWASTNDSRITPLGNFLRKSRIDELPQFWNVLKGEMSMVGPRPERPEFTSLLDSEIPYYPARHAVKPGLTGWAQVMYRYGASIDDALIKLRYDLYYIKHQSIALDLVCLFKTFGVLIGLKGR